MLDRATRVHQQEHQHGHAVIDWVDDRVRSVRLIGHLDWITLGGLGDILGGPCDGDAVIVILEPDPPIGVLEAEILLTAISHAQATGLEFVLVCPDHALTAILYATDIGFTVPVLDSVSAAMHLIAAHQSRLARHQPQIA